VTPSDDGPGRSGAAGDTPRFLFVPGGGKNGLGESARSLVLAQAVEARWPGARIGFVTGSEHPRLPQDRFERHTVPGRVSRSIEAVSAIFVGDVPSVDVVGARAAGLAPLLVDRHDLYTDWEVPRLKSIAELPGWLQQAGQR